MKSLGSAIITHHDDTIPIINYRLEIASLRKWKNHVYLICKTNPDKDDDNFDFIVGMPFNPRGYKFEKRDEWYVASDEYFFVRFRKMRTKGGSIVQLEVFKYSLLERLFKKGRR